MNRILFFLLLPVFLYSQSPVYFGAQGFGGFWTWPASYEVYVVTNLNDSGAGSLRDAVTSAISTNGRIVVFNGLSGTITLTSAINYSQAKALYIAGQTSQNGVLIRSSTGVSINGLLNISNGNVILRGLTFARGVPAQTDYCCGDNINIFGGTNHLIDQCTFLWGADESVPMKDGTNITIQRSIIAESLQQPPGWTRAAGRGSLMYNNVDKVTSYRVLWVSNMQRNPLWGGGDPDPPLDEFEMVQNVIYNWGQFGMVAESWRDVSASLINNVAIPGANTLSGRYAFTMGGNDNTSKHIAYLRDNYDGRYRTSPLQAQNLMLGCTGGTCGGTYHQEPAPSSRYTFSPYNYPMDGVVSLSRDDVVAAVLADAGDLNDAGGLTSAIKTSVSNATNVIINQPSESVTGGYPTISNGTIITDSDNDGIPDSEEASWGNNTFGYVNELAAEGGSPVDPGGGGGNPPFNPSGLINAGSELLISH